MEKICRVLYKNSDFKDYIAFEVYLNKQSANGIYLSKQSDFQTYFEAYWKGPLNDVLFYETDNQLDTLRKRIDNLVEKLGYHFLFQEYQN